MKKIYILIICGFLIGCGGSNNYGSNGVITGKILRPGLLPPGANNTNVYVYIQGISADYTGRPLKVDVNPDDGSFSVSINLGVKSLGPPVTYNSIVAFDIYLNVNGIWWIAKPDDTNAVAFMPGVPVEADKTVDIGTHVMDLPIGSFWK